MGRASVGDARAVATWAGVPWVELAPRRRTRELAAMIVLGAVRPAAEGQRAGHAGAGAAAHRS